MMDVIKFDDISWHFEDDDNANTDITEESIAVYMGFFYRWMDGKKMSPPSKPER